MTRKEVIALCQTVQRMPYCQLNDAGCPVLLTRREYDQQMARPNRAWRTPCGVQAWYDDAASKVLQDAWYETARVARKAVKEWEASHRSRIPQWAKKL